MFRLIPKVFSKGLSGPSVGLSSSSTAPFFKKVFMSLTLSCTGALSYRNKFGCSSLCEKKLMGHHTKTKNCALSNLSEHFGNEPHTVTSISI